MAPADTLPALLHSVAARTPGGPAIIDDGAQHSFSAIERRAYALAAGLQARGIGPGDRVAVWLPNRCEWVVALFALARLRAVCISVNTRFRAAELEDIIGRTGCSALIFEPEFHDIDFEAILRRVAPGAMHALRLVAGVPDKAPTAVVDGADHVAFTDLFENRPGTLPDCRPDDGAVVFTTSGTTARPKFVLHTQRSLAVHAKHVARAFDYTAEDTVLLQALPLCGTFGLAQALAAISAGRPSVMMPAFDAAQAVDHISRHQVTTFNASDEMLERICNVSQPDDLASVKWCGFASFVHSRVAEFAERCDRSGLRVAGLYGLSEVQALYARQPLDLPAADRAVAGGALTSRHAKVEVRDPATGRRLPAGRSGELCLKGPSRMLEYMGDPDATSTTIDEEGFVRSGDLGRLLDDGRLVFETRIGDGIRLGGFLVNPAEIDTWLERHPSVVASQTVAVEVGERVRPVSFVIAADGGTIEERDLVEHCTHGLARFKVPERIIALDVFPATDGPNGKKIQRGQLRIMAEDHCK